MTRRLGETRSRRDALKVVAGGLATALLPTLVACGETSESRGCAQTCGYGCCASDEVCVEGTCYPPTDAVKGRYGDVAYEAYVSGPAQAVATFRLRSHDPVMVVIDGEADAVLTTSGQKIDGYGALTTAEASLLADLDIAPLDDAFRMIPLELSCERDDLDARLYAALLFQWQLLHKYRTPDRFESLQRYASLAPCLYLASMFDYTRMPKPLPRHNVLPNSFPFPQAFGYVPLDEVGWLEGSTTGALACGLASTPLPSAGERQESERGPTGAPCRGACGADCDPRNYARNEGSKLELVCTTNADGKLTGEIEEWGVYEMGMHEGCVTHDACYDRCAQTVGECLDWFGLPIFCFDNPRAFGCYRACDVDCLDEYGWEACKSWKDGGGPFEGYQVFEYKISTHGAPDRCPPDPTLYQDAPPPWWDDWDKDGYVPCERQCRMDVTGPPIWYCCPNPAERARGGSEIHAPMRRRGGRP